MKYLEECQDGKDLGDRSELHEHSGGSATYKGERGRIVQMGKGKMGCVVREWEEEWGGENKRRMDGCQQLL